MCLPSAPKDETSPSEQPHEEPVGEARSPPSQSEDAALPPEEEVGVKKPLNRQMRPLREKKVNHRWRRKVRGLVPYESRFGRTLG